MLACVMTFTSSYSAVLPAFALESDAAQPLENGVEAEAFTVTENAEPTVVNAEEAVTIEETSDETPAADEMTQDANEEENNTAEDTAAVEEPDASAPATEEITLEPVTEEITSEPAGEEDPKPEEAPDDNPDAVTEAAETPEKTEEQNTPEEEFQANEADAAGQPVEPKEPETAVVPETADSAEIAEAPEVSDASEEYTEGKLEHKSGSRRFTLSYDADAMIPSDALVDLEEIEEAEIDGDAVVEALELSGEEEAGDASYFAARIYRYNEAGEQEEIHAKAPVTCTFDYENDDFTLEEGESAHIVKILNADEEQETENDGDGQDEANGPEEDSQQELPPQKAEELETDITVEDSIVRKIEFELEENEEDDLVGLGLVIVRPVQEQAEEEKLVEEEEDEGLQEEDGEPSEEEKEDEEKSDASASDEEMDIEASEDTEKSETDSEEGAEAGSDEAAADVAETDDPELKESIDPAKETDKAETAVAAVPEDLKEPVEETEEKAEQYEPSAGSAEVKEDAYTISVTFDEEAGLPKDTNLNVKEIGRNSTSYDNYYGKLREYLGNDTAIEYVQFYDLTLTAGDKELHPEGNVSVSMKYRMNDGVPEGADRLIVHFTKDGVELKDHRKAESPEDNRGVINGAKKLFKKGFNAAANFVTGNSGVEETAEFRTDGFSVYGVVYTVDFHYEVNGKNYDFSIDGGSFATLGTIVGKLGIDANEKNFLAGVRDVEFSDPSLVWVGKAESDTTVGTLKEENGLAPAYSIILTPERLEEMDAAVVREGDWALISLQPFNSDETLTVTMQNGDAFTVNVTDAGGDSKTLEVHTTDYDGNVIQTGEFGNGYTLYFYEIPTSVLGITGNDLSTKKWFDLRNALLGLSDNDRKKYRGSVKVNSTEEHLTLTMESDASESNPYILIMLGDDLTADSGMIPMPEWGAESALWYDGNTVGVCDESATVKDQDTYVINVRHDNSLFTPKLTYRFDSSSYAGEGDIYPAQIKIQGPEGTVEQTVNGDGEYIVNLPFKISRNMLEGRPDGALQPLGVIPYTAELKDPDGCGWTMSSSDDVHASGDGQSRIIYIVNADDDKNLLGVSLGSGKPQLTSEKLVITFTKTPDPNRVVLNVRTTDYDGNLITAEELGEGYELFYIDSPLSKHFSNYTLNDLMNGRGSVSRFNVTSGGSGGLATFEFKSVRITAPEQKIVLSTSKEASPDNPYVLFFVGDKNRTDLFCEWYAEEQFFYDGTKFYDFNSGQRAAEVNDSTTVTVRHDNTMRDAKLTVTFDASEYVSAGGTSPYPVTCSVMYDNNSGINYPDDVIGSVTADNDGLFTIDLTRRFSDRVMKREEWNGFDVYLKLTDPSGEVIQHDWSVKDNSGQAGSPNRMMLDIYRLDDEGNIFGRSFDYNTGAYTEPTEKTVVTYSRSLAKDKMRIETYELRTGELASQDTMSSGFDLVYYEIPSNVWGGGYTKDYLLENAYYPYTMLMYPAGSSTIDYSPYKKTIHIDSNTVNRDLIVNNNATEAVPYVYVFIGEDRELRTIRTYKEWDSAACYLYDGSQAYPLQGVREDGSTMVVAVTHDDSMIKPILNVKLDASDYVSKASPEDSTAYPVTVSARSAYYYQSEEVTAEANADGTYTLEWKEPVSRLRSPFSSPNGVMPFVVTIKDDTESKSYTWELSNTELSGPYGRINPNTATIYCKGIGEDGILHAAVFGEQDENTGNYQISEGGACIPVFVKKMNGIVPRVKVMLSAETGAFEDEEFPLYLKIRTVDNYDRSWETTKVVPITAADLNTPFTIRLDRADPYLVSGVGDENNPLDIYYTVYKDENCTEVDEGWGPVYNNAQSYWDYVTDPNNDGIWTTYGDWYNQETGQWQYDSNAPMTLYYNYVKPAIPYASFTNDSQGMYPAYLKVTGFDQEKIVNLTENGGGSIIFNKMPIWDIYGKTISWTVYADEECTKVHPDWNIENQSVRVQWNGTMLMDYNNYRSPANIDLSKVKASILTVPVETSIGDLDAGLFFPAYMTAVLHSEDGLFTDVIVSEKMESVADANFDLVFQAKENEQFNSDGKYSLYAVVTSSPIEVTSINDLYERQPSDEYVMAHQNEIKKNWAQAVGNYEKVPDITATLQGDGKLHQGLSTLKLVYKPVTVDVQPDPYLVQPENITVRTWLYDDMTDDRTIYDTRKITDKRRFTVQFPVLGFTGAELNAASVMTEKPDELVWKYHMEIPTSKGTYFYSSANAGSVGVNGKLSNAGEEMILKPFESNKAYTSVEVPVIVHIPEDGNYHFYNNRKIPDTGNPYEWAFLALSRVDPDTGNREYVQLGSENNPYYHYSDYSSAAIRLSKLGDDWTGTIDGRMREPILPGTYYLDYGISYIWNSSYAFINQYIEEYWTNESNIKVILTQDGKLTWENGEPVELHYYYQSFLPDFDVHAELPDGSEDYDGLKYDPLQSYDKETEATPMYFHYQLSPVNSSYSGSISDTVLFRTTDWDQTDIYQNIRNGDLSIGSPSRRYSYVQYLLGNNPDYSGKPVIDSAYSSIYNYNNYDGLTPYIYISSGSLNRFYNYPDSNVAGYPAGDYRLTYYTGSSSTVRDHWYSETDLKVHLAEDGKLYEILEDGTYSTEPYVMQIRYTGEKTDPAITHDSLKIKINTTVKDGVDKSRAFTEGDTFVAMVTEIRTDNGNQRTDYFAVGTAQITEVGTMELELKKPDGSPVVLHKDAVYNMSYGTFHNWTGSFNDSSVNQAWPYYNNLDNAFTYVYGSQNYHPNTTYPMYFTPGNVDEDGNIKGFVYQNDPSGSSYYAYEHYIGRTSQEGDTDGEPLIFENSSLILPWKETNPGTISQASSDDSVIYKPISDISTIKEKGNYIIVVQNQYNRKWYALYVDENGGNSVELTDVSSLEDLEEGYKVDVSDQFRKMIFTANKVTPGSDSVSLQFKSGYKNENGKMISMKMGQSSDDPEPLLSESAGTVIVRNGTDKQFSVTKGNYSWLWYVDQLYGWTGFTTISNKFGPKYAGQYGSYGNDYLLYGLLNASRSSREEYQKWVDSGSNPYGRYSALSVYAGVSDDHSQYNKYMADVDSKYLNQTYLGKLRDINSSYPGAGYSQFYILSDDVEAVEPEEPVNKYTLVKTFGDFIQTFCGSGGNQANNMLLVYTDADGREYAMESEKLYEVVSKAGGSGYRTVTTVADHLLIPNNNSGTSSNFSIEPVEVKEDGTYVFATPFAFRKSRQNNTDNKNYMTMNAGGGENAWTKNDDASHGENLVYVMHPDNDVFSQADWDKVQNYKLSVVRNGETKWLGVAEVTDENGSKTKQMTVVDSEEKAVSFKVYTDKLTRYYSSAYGTDLYKYYKVNSITDINAGDEILIVYNDNGTKRIMGVPFKDNGRYDVDIDSYYYSSYAISPAVQVLDSAGNLDTRDPDVVTVDSKYQYRLGTSEYVKKPFAYKDAEDETVIWAQGVSANAIGNAKSESNKQRKYESVSPLGNMREYIYIKAGFADAYSNKGSAETNFFPGDKEGEFYIRGGKSDAWLGTTHYKRNLLSLTSGRYEYTGNYLSFTTVDKANRIAVEIYRRPASDEIFQIQYYTEENTLDHTENKPKDTFTLTQKQDVEKDGNKYVFVGFTTDYDKSGYLSLDDSANLYDYDDLAKLASIKKDIKQKYDLLGDCNPEADNLIDYNDVADKIKTETIGGKETDVLKVYPVYALRGYSAAVTANDKDSSGNDRMIVGASDFKDLQNGASGATDSKERWLGSINIEVYKDGVLWVPGAGGSTIGRKLMAAPKAAPKATLYFAYHNDNAADLNIKFIADGITKDTLYAYMSSGDFSAAEPSENYVIDAVYAEQGGSEDGLKYRLNWMHDVVGGQLDNVKGGSTVRIYVTTKYQVKYYLDKADGNGYQKLNSDVWTDPEYYTTPGTQKAIDEKETSADYVMTTDPATSYNMSLIDRTPTDGTTFKDAKMIRGEYSEFLYKFNEYPHVIPVAGLPREEKDGIPKGTILEDPGNTEPGSWVIRNPELDRITDHVEKTDLPVTDTTYGTGNSGWAYKGVGDAVYTYHLYAKVKKGIDIDIVKISDDGQDHLNGAVFSLRQLDETKPGIAEKENGIKQEVTTARDRATGEDGRAAFRNLTDGVYEIKETTPPEGYMVQEDGIFYIRISKGIATVISADTKKTPSEWSEPRAVPNAMISVRSGQEVGGDNTDEPASESQEPQNTQIIVKNKPALTEVRVKKHWNDAENNDGIRPAKVTVILTANGKKTDKQLELSEKNEWCGVFEELEKYADGEEIKYGIMEVSVEGYTSEITEDTEKNYIVTNTHKPQKTRISVLKVWEDQNNQDGKRPEKITIRLLANDKEIDHIVLSARNQWQNTFTDLPVFRSGKKITYSVREDNVKDYQNNIKEEQKGSRFIITNTYTPGLTQLAVTKVWEDGHDADGIRPSQITVILTADGKATDRKLVLNKENKWSGTFHDLAEYADGKKIIYSIQEIKVEGYTVEITGDAERGFTITNRHTPKKPEVPETPREYRERNDPPPEIRTPGRQDQVLGVVRETAPALEEPVGDVLGASRTGDDSHMTLYGIIALASAAGLTACFLLYRKRRQQTGE